MYLPIRLLYLDAIICFVSVREASNSTSSIGFPFSFSHVVCLSLSVQELSFLSTLTTLVCEKNKALTIKFSTRAPTLFLYPLLSLDLPVLTQVEHWVHCAIGRKQYGKNL